MLDLSLHVLDIAENSIRAGAGLIEIELNEDKKTHLLTLIIKDNGNGMNEQTLNKVSSPFFTTRTTRRVGLGLALLKQNCEQSGGSLQIDSQIGKGTRIVATMQSNHIDCIPVGDMTSTLMTLISANPDIDWVYCTCRENQDLKLDTRQVRAVLQDVPINHPEVIKWIKDYLLG